MRRQSIDDASKGLKTTAEVAADQRRRARRLSDDNGCVVRGRGIRDASEGSEKTMEAAGDRRRARGIYDDDGDVGGGI